MIEPLESRLLMAAARRPVQIQPGNVPSATPDATININPAQQFQTINGLGVNLNSAAWNNGAVKPWIDELYSTMGASMYRVIVEAVAGWEDTNDNSDPFVANTTYYNNLYSTTKFTNLWNTIEYLNDLDQPVLLNVMGYLPAWLGGADSVPSSLQDELVEMEATMLNYAVNTKGLKIDYFSVLNEQDWGHNEGPLFGTTTAGVNAYVSIVNKLITRLNGLGLGSIQIVGGETAFNSTQYANALLASNSAMQKIQHFAFHDYTDSVGQFLNFDQAASNAGYPGRNFWVTEFAEPTPLDLGGEPPNGEWNFAELSVKYLIDYLNTGASGAAVYDGIDSLYQHHDYTVNSHGMIKWNSATNTYTVRKRMYAHAQVDKFVRPGMRRITSTDASSNLNQTTFYNAAAGQLAIVGQNLSNSAMTIQVNLGSLPFTSLELYQTNSTLNMARQADAVVTASSVTITIPAHTTFTLANPDATAPAVSLQPSQPPPADGSAAYDFKVLLSDAGVGGIDLASLGNTDLRVTGPGGFDALATLVGTDYLTNGSPRIATYRVNAPGGFWDSIDNGSYTIALEANEIKDAHNIFAVAATLGAFNVSAQFAVINPAGVLVINGTASGDTFTLGTSASSVTVLRGAANLIFESAGITSILVNGFEQSDQLNLGASLSQPIAFDGAGGTNLLNVNAGSFNYLGDPQAQGVQTINIAAGATLAFASAANIAVLNLAGTLSGAGDVTITQSGTWSAGELAGGGLLTIAAGAVLNITVPGEAISSRPLQIDGTVTLMANGSRMLRTTSLSLGAAGALDLMDNALLIDYAGGSPLATINAKLQSGYASGSWNGAGIRSSSAAGSGGSRSLGLAEAADIYSSFPATFAGSAVPDNTALLIRYTLPADANLDRAVDIQDLYQLATNWQLPARRWSQGDFNHDGGTNAVDLAMLAARWQQTLAIPAPPLLASVGARRTPQRVISLV